MRRKYRQPKTRAQTRPRPKSVVMAAAAAATAAAEAAEVVEVAEPAEAAAVGCARDGAERREEKMRRIG